MSDALVDVPYRLKSACLRGGRRLAYGLVLLSAAIGLFCFVSNAWIALTARTKTYASVHYIPKNEVGLVLGTSRRLRNGHENPYFKQRIRAAATLYHEGKVKHLILSGDNRTVYYNEPADMRRALVALGVPTSAITLDYAGLRTLDSVVRCKEIFGQDRVTIITQRDHAARALYLARNHGLQAIAFAADSPPKKAPRQEVREWLARCKAVLDVHVLHAQPRFLGRAETVRI